jgi:hypothetical protein
MAEHILSSIMGDTITGAVERIIGSAIEETIVSLKRERKGERIVVIYFTIFKPREDITEEDAGDFLNTLDTLGILEKKLEEKVGVAKADAVLRIGDTEFLIWITYTKLSDVFYFDTILDNIMHFSSGDYDKVQLQLDEELPKDLGISESMERLLDITYIIIPQGKVRADDVYELMKKLSDSASSKFESSKYVVKMRIFDYINKLEKLRNKLTRLEINDTYLLKDENGYEGELVANLLTPSQVLDKGVYKAVFGR